MKSIIISIKPQYVEKILNGEKTIEIRKTMPKCELPVKVYIYCTMPTKKENRKPHYWSVFWLKRVVAEFTLNKVDLLVDMCAGIHYADKDYNLLDPNDLLRKSCLTEEQIYDYVGENRRNNPFYNDAYAWHIDDLKIYDKPKKLSEFSHYIKDNSCIKKECGTDCEDCFSYDHEHETCLELYYLYRQIKKPPTNYMFVEELED